MGALFSGRFPYPAFKPPDTGNNHLRGNGQRRGRARTGIFRKEWRTEMRIPARALKPLVAMAIAAASFGCIAPAAYAENATAAEQAAEADLYKRTKQAEAARIERQNESDAELYSAQKDAEGIKAKATAEAEATRLKGESEGAAEKAHGEGVAASIKAQAEAYNGMDNPYLLANRYIDIMPKVAEQVAKPLTAVDSIKMYGSGNAQKLVKETTSIVDQVASGLKDSTGIDLPSLLNGLISNPDIDADSAENSVE